MSPDFTEDQLDALQGKPRPKGSLPYLTDDRRPEFLRAWLTRAFRPPEGWRVESFERLGPEREHPAILVVANGREARRLRFKRQRDLRGTPRSEVAAVANGWLNMPHLTGGEVEDVWMALCALGQVLTEHDEPEQTREWVESFLPATLPLNGFSLVPDARHDALMAIRHAGAFGKGDALALTRPNEDQRFAQRPTRFRDSGTGEQWIRPTELAAFVRWVIGVEPLAHATLRARLHEIGVVGRYFEDYRPPHPKLALYQLTTELIDHVEGPK
jgi:hypothetical protein